MDGNSGVGVSLLVELLEAVALITVLAYAFSKTRAFEFVTSGGWPPEGRQALKPWVGMYLFFTGMAVLGTYLGVPVLGAIANTRATGAVLAGLLGGARLGLAVGATAGLHRYLLGGFTGVACGLSTVAEGLTGAVVGALWRRRGGTRPQPVVAFVAALVAECLQMAIILLLAEPYAEAEALVYAIALPMISMNAIGAGLFASIVEDQRRSRELNAAHFARLALEVGEKSITLLKAGFTPEAAKEWVSLLRETLPVAAVAVTGRKNGADGENVMLAFGGLGDDHHHGGDEIRCPRVLDAVAHGQVEFLDGDSARYECPVDPDCPLSSALIVPLVVDEEVLGTIILFEPRGRPFAEVFRSFGEGLASLLSAQLLQARVQEQRKLLVSSELKLLQAQINPHFLFNALTAIRAIVHSDPVRARELIAHLGDFLRSNLRKTTPDVALEDELALVGAYLEIEKARFGERLSVEVHVPGHYSKVRVPTFTLQPLVENAIKHGLSDKVEQGCIRISAAQEGQDIVLSVEDNGGSYQPPSESASGLGLSLVDRRVASWGGPGYGTQVSCSPGERTCVSVRIPSRVNP